MDESLTVRTTQGYELAMFVGDALCVSFVGLNETIAHAVAKRMEDVYFSGQEDGEPTNLSIIVSHHPASQLDRQHVVQVFYFGKNRHGALLKLRDAAASIEF